MRRLALGIGAATILFAAGIAFARDDGADRGNTGGATTSFSTTYTVWSVDPPAPLDGSDLPSR
jgi:hypothetical protein